MDAPNLKHLLEDGHLLICVADAVSPSIRYLWLRPVSWPGQIEERSLGNFVDTLLQILLYLLSYWINTNHIIDIFSMLVLYSKKTFLAPLDNSKIVINNLVSKELVTSIHTYLYTLLRQFPFSSKWYQKPCQLCNFKKWLIKSQKKSKCR